MLYDNDPGRVGGEVLDDLDYSFRTAGRRPDSDNSL